MLETFGDAQEKYFGHASVSTELPLIMVEILPLLLLSGINSSTTGVKIVGTIADMKMNHLQATTHIHIKQ